MTCDKCFSPMIWVEQQNAWRCSHCWEGTYGEEETMEKYYYIRDEKNRPIITVCLIKDGETVSRGWAVCSPSDNPVKAIGRGIALGRALQAMKNKKSGSPICDEWQRSKLTKAFVQVGFSLVVYLDGFKSQFGADLTEFERKILRREKDGH